MTIADVFDALSIIHPYTFEEAIDIMSKDNGSLYSPEIFDVFMENKEMLRCL